VPGAYYTWGGPALTFMYDPQGSIANNQFNGTPFDFEQYDAFGEQLFYLALNGNQQLGGSPGVANYSPFVLSGAGYKSQSGAYGGWDNDQTTLS